MFVTTAEFLPQHRRQLAQTRQLITQAEQRGHQRLAEMNQTIEKNLTAIITGLTAGCACDASGQSCNCSAAGPEERNADDAS